MTPGALSDTGTIRPQHAHNEGNTRPQGAHDEGVNNQSHLGKGLRQPGHRVGFGLWC